MASAPLAIEITARLDKFRTEMAKIPDIGGKEAKALTAQLSREIKAATKAAEDSARASKPAKAGFDSMGEAAGKAGSNTMKLAGAASIASPALGEMTRNAGDAFDVLEVLGAISGPLAAGFAVVGAALVTGAAAWKIYNADAEENARISAEVTAAQERLAPILDATRQASIDLDEATGRLNETQAKQARDQLAAWSQLQAATSETRQKIQDLQADQQSFGTVAVDTLEAIIPAWTPFGYILRKTTTDSEDLKIEMDALGNVITEGQVKTKELVKITGAAAAADRDGARAKDQLKDATAAQAKALADAIKASEEEARANADARASIEAIRKVGEDAAQSSLTGEAAVIAKREEALAQLREMYQASVALQTTDSGRLMAQVEFARAQVEVEEAAQVEITEIRKEEGKKREDLAKKEAEAQQRYAVSAVQGSADLMGAISSLAANAQDGMTKEQKEAAKVLFGVQLAAGIAQATINAALAVSEAQASAPYPYNIPAIAAAAVTGAANVAAIASTPAPTFSDTPGPVMAGNGVGRTSVNVSAGDMVVASRTKEGLRAQVDPYAKRTDGANVTIINRRTFGATVRDDVRVNSPLARLSASSPTALGFR